MKSQHILIVDDSTDQLLLLKSLLESKGYTTDCTSNGAEALSLLRTSKTKPQTILLDLNMPVMDGYEFRNLQRADPKLSGIPVVIMSGEDDVNETRRRTSADIVKKPYNIKTLMSALERNTHLH